MFQKRIPATVTILTYNSAAHVRRCLESVQAFEEILVLDGGSTDETLDIAREFGARILAQSDVPGPIHDFTAVRIRSFEAASHDWIFWIDSDEYADETLIQAISEAVSLNQKNIAYRASKIPVLSGAIIRHAYFLPDFTLRLVRKSTAEWARGKKVHEHLKTHENVKGENLAGAVYTPWGSLDEQYKKDRYYIHLAFSKPVLKRPAFKVMARSVRKNLMYAGWIFCVALYLAVRYGRAGGALPFKHHLRFARYHLLVVRERLRQWTLGTAYEPPQA